MDTVGNSDTAADIDSVVNGAVQQITDFEIKATAKQQAIDRIELETREIIKEITQMYYLNDGEKNVYIQIIMQEKEKAIENISLENDQKEIDSIYDSLRNTQNDKVTSAKAENAQKNWVTPIACLLIATLSILFLASRLRRKTIL